MKKSIFDDLRSERLISDESFEKVRSNSSAPFSIHWELKTILYLGVMAISAGLAILVYENIESISHQAVLVAIAILSAGCFTWCYRMKAPFSMLKVESPNSLFDYILLLGCLSFLTFVSYLQFQFEIFGLQYGLATFVPMVFLFFMAYYFDHLGILTMAIANLALWMGVSLTPKDIFQRGDFAGEQAIYIYLGLGLFLFIMKYISELYDLKKHFCFTYQHLGTHLTFISLLTGYFFYDAWYAVLWLVLFTVAASLIYQDAFKKKSFYFIVLTILYCYIGATGFLSRAVFDTFLNGGVYLMFAYFIISGVALARLLMAVNRKIRS